MRMKLWDSFSLSWEIIIHRSLSRKSSSLRSLTKNGYEGLGCGDPQNPVIAPLPSRSLLPSETDYLHPHLHHPIVSVPWEVKPGFWSVSQICSNLFFFEGGHSARQSPNHLETDEKVTKAQQTRMFSSPAMHQSFHTTGRTDSSNTDTPYWWLETHLRVYFVRNGKLIDISDAC